MSLFLRFKEYIFDKNLISRGDSILLAVSGGPDSLTMLDLFTRIKKELELDIVVFHLNHMFRPEADKDAEFVKEQADRYGLKSVIEEFDVPDYIEKKGLSPEEGAREVRFNLLTEWAHRLQTKKIVFGHNKDDLVETIFLNMIRGSGLKGLCGIEPISEYEDVLLIHPLLDIYRQEIEKYCQQRGLTPRSDSSNQHTIYTRNRVRHDLIPLIEKKINPAVKEIMARMADHLRQEEYFLQDLAREAYNRAVIKKMEKKLVLSLSVLQESHPVIRHRIIKQAVRKFKGNIKDFYTVHYRAVNRLIKKGETGKIIQLKGDLQVRRSYDRLILEQEKDIKVENYSYRLRVAGSVKVNNIRITSKIISKNSGWKNLALSKKNCLVDLKSVELPLTVRNRREGDRFVPFGMNDFKKIKDFFIDEKIPAGERDKIPLIIDADGKIVWIAGYRVDNRFRVTAGTDKILKLSILQEGK
ncbi:MAG: tRNA lysidine(34) synthetase TilS [Halanaerobiaceae bacterium]